MLRLSLYPLVMALLLSLTPWAQAEIYKWKDANGKIHFSDKPVTGAQKQQSGHVNRIANPTFNLDSLRSEVPYRIRNGSMLVEAEVNGVQQTFVIDTGASFVVIPPQLARKAGISTKGARMVQLQTANGLTSAPMVTLDKLNLNGVERRNVTAVIQPVDAAGHVGLLGMSFLGAFQTNFDHQRQIMVLEKR